MRALSLRQAARCETAKHPHCKCRCGGKLHGAFRNSVEGNRQAMPEQEFFELLPEDDAHRIPSAEEKKQKARARREKRKARGQGLLWAVFEEKADDVPPEGTKDPTL